MTYLLLKWQSLDYFICEIFVFISYWLWIFLFILQDCTQVPTDGKRHTSFNASYGLYDGNLDQLNPPITSEIKDGQWLGVEVQSQGEGGKVIVCAHR